MKPTAPGISCRAVASVGRPVADLLLVWRAEALPRYVLVGDKPGSRDLRVLPARFPPTWTARASALTCSPAAHPACSGQPWQLACRSEGPGNLRRSAFSACVLITGTRSSSAKPSPRTTSAASSRFWRTPPGWPPDHRGAYPAGRPQRPRPASPDPRQVDQRAAPTPPRRPVTQPRSGTTSTGSRRRSQASWFTEQGSIGARPHPPLSEAKSSRPSTILNARRGPGEALGDAA